MCIFLFDGRVGSLGGREQAAQAEKKGFRFNRQTIPMSLRQHIRVESDLKNKKIINPVDKVNGKWYIYKRRKC